MRQPHFALVFCSILAWPLSGLAANASDKTDVVHVHMSTSLGNIELELDAKHAPLTVANFRHYANSGFYNGTIFHRVIPGFMVQGGGFVPGLKEKHADKPIRNEADNGLKNLTGTIAMARTPDPHSATAQFFINTVDNPNLDYRNKSMQGWGYCVFGKVTKGMDVVRKIEAVPTGNSGMLQNVPLKDVVITKVEIRQPKTKVKSKKK